MPNKKDTDYESIVQRIEKLEEAVNKLSSSRCKCKKKCKKYPAPSNIDHIS